LSGVVLDAVILISGSVPLGLPFDLSISGLLAHPIRSPEHGGPGSGVWYAKRNGTNHYGSGSTNLERSFVFRFHLVILNTFSGIKLSLNGGVE
jgi:hypothetical protein